MDNLSDLFLKESEKEKEKIINMLEYIIENRSEYNYITLVSEINDVHKYTNENLEAIILKFQMAEFFNKKDKKINDILGDNYG